MRQTAPRCEPPTSRFDWDVVFASISCSAQFRPHTLYTIQCQMKEARVQTALLGPTLTDRDAQLLYHHEEIG